MKTVFLLAAFFAALLGCGAVSVSKSAIHEILAVLAFMGSIMSLGLYVIICRLEDIRAAVRHRR